MLLLLVVMLLLLHTLYGFFCLCGIAQHVQKPDDLPVLVGRIFQSVLHPAVGLAADIEKEIAFGNFNNIINGWLIAVQINAAVQQRGYLSTVSLVTEDFPDPVVCGENGRDNVQLIGCCGSVLGGTAGKHSCRNPKCQQQRKYFFHKVFTSKS